MCKQEDYFKKLIYMHKKKKKKKKKKIYIYTSMSCKHREAQAVQSFGMGDKSTLDLTENSCSNQQLASKAERKSIRLSYEAFSRWK